MAESDQQGTEAPTQRRRDDARKEGQVVQSPDLASAIAVFTGLMSLMWFSGPVGSRLLDAIRVWFREVPASDWTDAHTIMGARWLSWEILGTSGMLVVLLMAIGLGLGFLQVGFVISWKPLNPDWARLSPAKGLERLLSVESAVRGMLGAMKVVGLLIVSTTIIWFRRDELNIAHFTSLTDILTYGWKLGLTIGISLASVILVLAAIDYITKWFRNEEKLKMTPEEIKRENKDDSGDPTLKMAMRRRQREAIKNGSVADVPEATMVITNPTHLAIAIKYEQGTMSAPKVVAKGDGIFAKNIRDTAKKHGVPVVERKPLARALYRTVRVGQEIPSEFFHAVAEILAQIWKMRRSAA
jgi:flagellar biosynthetic protein FlhB